MIRVFCVMYQYAKETVFISQWIQQTVLDMMLKWHTIYQSKVIKQTWPKTTQPW